MFPPSGSLPTGVGADEWATAARASIVPWVGRMHGGASGNQRESAKPSAIAVATARTRARPTRRHRALAAMPLAWALVVGGCGFDRGGLLVDALGEIVGLPDAGPRAPDTAAPPIDPPRPPGTPDAGPRDTRPPTDVVVASDRIVVPPPPDAATPVDRPTSPPDVPPDRPPDLPVDLSPDRPPPVDAPPAVIVRINVNGPAHNGLDFPGAWAADPGPGGVCGPNIYRNDMPVAGTRDDVLFQGEMYGNPLVCAVGRGALPSGRYQVNLYFAEIFWGPGCPGGGNGVDGRLFDIRIEGALVASGVNLFREAGCASSPMGNGRPVVKRFVANITDGTLDLRFQVETDNAKISAIELISTF
jgi:hypothetical protein